MIFGAIDKFLITNFEREDEAKSLERAIRCFFLFQLFGEFYLVLALLEIVLSRLGKNWELVGWEINNSLIFSFGCNFTYTVCKRLFFLGSCLLEQKIPSFSFYERCRSLVNYWRSFPIYQSSDYKHLKALTKSRDERDWLFFVIVELRKYNISIDDSQRCEAFGALQWYLQHAKINPLLRSGVVSYLNNFGIFVSAITDSDLN